MTNNVNIQVNALGNFSPLNAEVAKLKASMLELQKIPLTGAMGKEIAQNTLRAQKSFEAMVVASRAFNIEAVKMTDAIDHFATKLEKGQVGLRGAWNIWRAEAKGASSVLDDLATRQTRLLKSTFLPDPTKSGYAKAITSVSANVKELGAVQEYAAIRASALNSIMKEVGTGLVNFGKNTQWAGRQLTVGLSVPLAAFGSLASKAFNQVDQELTRMSKVYGDGLTVTSQKTINVIRKQTLELASELARAYGMSAQQTASTAADLAATGLQGQELLNATRETMRLSTLGELDQQSAIKATVALQRTFRLSNKDLADSVNYLNAVENQTSTSLADLVEALPRAAVIVKELGGSYKDLSAMMVAMREAGVPAAEGANAIKSAMASIINPSKKATQELSSFGINIKEITTKNAGNLLQTVMDLQSALYQLNPQDRIRIIEELFGKFQFAKVTALLDNLGKAGSQTTKAFELAGASSAQLAKLAEQELAQQANSVSGQFKRAMESFRTELLPIGERFVKFGTKIINVFSKVLDLFNKIPAPVKDFITILLGTGALIGPVIMLVGLFTNLIGNIFKAYTAFKMFREGGLSNLSNYFTKVDLSLVAAKENQDHLTASVMTTADAYKMLTSYVETYGVMLKSIAGQQIVSATQMHSTLSAALAGRSFSELFQISPLISPSGKIGGNTKPHMYAGKKLAEDWESMSPEQRAQYPSLSTISQRQDLGPGFTQKKGYMRTGLSAQWVMASQGVPQMLNNLYKDDPAIYGGRSGQTKEAIQAPGIQKLITAHNEIINGLGKYDELTTAQLRSIFGEETVTLETLNKEQLAKVEKVMSTVTFSEEQFTEKLLNHLRQEAKILQGSKVNIDILDKEVQQAMTLAEENRVPAIKIAIDKFNATLTAEALAEVNSMTVAISQAFAGASSVGEIAMIAAEAQSGISLEAERTGVKQLAPSTAIDAKRIRSGISARYSPRLASGGYISGPGGPTDDRIPAMLSHGEYVVKADSVKKYGRGTLDAINNGYSTGGAIQKLKYGGNPDPEAKYERAHIVSDKSGFMLMMPRNMNKAMKSDAQGVTGAELRRFFENNASYGMLGAAGAQLGIPEKQIYEDLSNLKYHILNRIDNNAIYGGRNGINFEQIIGDEAVQNNLKGRWQLLSQVATIRNESDIAIALRKNLITQERARELIEESRGSYKDGRPKLNSSFAGAQSSQLTGVSARLIRTNTGTDAKMMGQILAAEKNAFKLMRASGGEVPAMVSNGEYLMSKGAVAKHGLGFMNMLNAGKFSDGGFIGPQTRTDAYYSAWSSAVDKGMSEEEANIYAEKALLGGPPPRRGISSKIRNKMGRAGSGIGGMMVAGTAINMASSALSSRVSNPIAGGAVSGAGMGAQLGMMAGPEGAAIGAIAGAALGGITAVITKSMTEMKNASLGLKDSLSVSGVALQHFGIKVGDLSNATILAATNNKKAMEEINQVASEYAAATDDQTKGALENLKKLSTSGDKKGVESLVAKKYAADIMAGMTSKQARTDISGYMIAGGVGGYTASNIADKMAAQKNVGLGDIFGGMKKTTVGRYGPMDTTDYAAAGAGISSTIATSDPAKLAAQIDALKQSKTAADQEALALMNSSKSFEEFNKTIQDTDLQKLNKQMVDNGAEATNVYRINSLLAHGMKLTADQMLNMSKNTYALAAAEHQLNQEGHVATAVTNAITKATSAGTGASNAATTSLQNRTNKLQDYIKKQQDAIDKINKEKDARQKAYDAGQKQIQQEQTLAQLRAGITRAGSSGDLLSIAEAQNAYNIELAKQNELKAKEAADAVDDQKIAGLQKNISGAQKKIDALNKSMQALQSSMSSMGATSNDVTDQMNSRINTLLSSGSYKNKDEFMAMFKGDKGLQGYIKQAHISADGLNTMLEDIWKTDGKSDAALNSSLGRSASHMMDFMGSTQKAMIMKKAFDLMIANPNLSPDAAVRQAIAAVNKGQVAANAAALQATGLSGAGSRGAAAAISDSGSGESTPGSQGGRAYGGYISGPGGPRDDLIPSMLSNGEYVIQAGAVSKYGRGMLDMINNGTLTPRFNTGGLMKDYSISSGNDSNQSLSNSSVYNITVNAGTNVSADEIANKVMKEIQKTDRSMSTGRTMGGF